MKIEINSLKELENLLNDNKGNNNGSGSIKDDIEIGKAYLIRAVTYHQVGTVSSFVCNKGTWFVKLEKSSWVVNSGNWNEVLKSGDLSQVEPFVKPSRIAIESIVDYTEWPHELPTKVK